MPINLPKDFSIKECVIHLGDKEVLIADVLLDLSSGMSRNEVAAKYGFEKKMFQVILRETSKFLRVFTPQGKGKGKKK